MVLKAEEKSIDKCENWFSIELNRENCLSQIQISETLPLSQNLRCFREGLLLQCFIQSTALHCPLPNKLL